ncbi:hypothetical protein SEPCBS119000_005085 [Sporothrix epigloea]|uniref:Mediator of RNA polymerase II transcription subunit 1 n=1 Tax=Sporothrix epigloea TaxID=1892477 RepID=A0ABP0DXU6_9PEZI
MKLAPSQQGRTPAAATPPVSTPMYQQQHPVFSPHGQQSSPQSIKKSPANSATLMGLSVSSSGVPSSMPTMGYDSPAAVGGLSMDLGGLDNVSIGGLSHLGLLGRNDDDERRDKGHVSEAGLERLAKCMGLECLWEEAMGGSGGSMRTLVVAGSALALEIGVANNIVESVSVTFPESRGIALQHSERADKILLRDLCLRQGESPLTKTLDRFAANLATLATLDKLSVEPGLNLFEALAGIYAELDRLFQWDLQQLRNEPTYSGGTHSEAALATVVQCARHGRPTMHERGHVGLGIDYWKQMRLVRPIERGEDDDDENDSDKTWSVQIRCAPNTGTPMYPPVRVSDRWLTDAIEKPDGRMLIGGIGELPELDWLEPESTIMPPIPTTDGAVSKLDANGASTASARLPDVRFHAVLDPPVALPLTLWHQINEVVGLVPETEAPATYDAILFPVPPGVQHDPSEPRTICRCKAMPVRGQALQGKKEQKTRTHQNTLFSYKPVYGCLLTELPFSHPSQLVRMLPTLRQYAFLASLLQSAFGEDTPSSTEAEDRKKEKEKSKAPAEQALQQPESRVKTSVMATSDIELERFIGRGGGKYAAAKVPAPREDTFAMDVVLTAHPVPRLQVVFPFRDVTADVVVEIGPNARVSVISQTVFDETDDLSIDDSGGKGEKRQHLHPQALGRALEVCEDLGVWCEWICRRYT